MDYKNRIAKFYNNVPQDETLYTSEEMYPSAPVFTKRGQKLDADTSDEKRAYNVVVTFDNGVKLLGHTMVFCNSRKDAVQAMEEAFVNIETFRYSLGNSMGVPEDVMANARFSIAIVEVREELDPLP